MERVSNNGAYGELNQYETPFADIPVMKEQTDSLSSSEGYSAEYFQEVDSPFSRTYEAIATNNDLTPAGEEFVDFLGELEDSEFKESLYELADEVEDTWRSKVSNEIAMGPGYIPFATQQAREYFSPLIKELESMIDKTSQHFSGNNLADHSETEVDTFFETIEFNHNQFSPAQEQFFGKIFKKVKSVVKKGIDLAKKGVSVVGKFLPSHIILNKLKGLLKPLLDKVLKFAIGKLPKNLQPFAHTFAKKFLKLETSDGESFIQNEDGLGAIQTELDNTIAQLVFSPTETEADNAISNYETSFESIERLNNYEVGLDTTNALSLDAARQQFINELKSLQPGESPAPAIERFLPVAIMAIKPIIKMAIKIIGRPKIINFLAGLLSKLVSKYVPENVAKPLAAGIIDVGLKIIGFEVHETGKSDLAYEAIATTIEETIENLEDINETEFNDNEALTMHLLEAFEQAAANNFPPQYIKEELRPTKQKATWINLPKSTPVKFYKKFTHVYDITIDAQTSNSVKIFRGLPLANFLRDKYGLDPSKPIKAKVHIYEAKLNSRLSLISKFENLPGLNGRQPKAWIQLLPLTKQASNLLLKEPSLGKDIASKHLATRFKTLPGQRFYFLEIDGARLRIPMVNRSRHKHNDNGSPHSSIESRSADIQAVINFIKSEIQLNYYFSEEDAKTIVEKLNGNDFIGSAITIRQSIKKVLHEILIQNISSKVKIIHEAIPELYFESSQDQEEEFSIGSALGKFTGKKLIAGIIEKLIGKISSVAYDAVVNFFKTRAAEFKQAQAQPQDGVTVKLIWKNVQGMSAIRAIINAIKGKLSIGNLSDLTIPNFTAPEIKIEADKQFS